MKLWHLLLKPLTDRMNEIRKIKVLQLIFWKTELPKKIISNKILIKQITLT